MDYAKVYGDLHEKGKVFSGYSIKDHVDAIADLVFLTDPKRILDYGSGKGYQYLGLRVHQKWGGLLPYCYDPGVLQLREKPDGLFQGVICTDVLEHIEEKDIPGVLADVFGYVDPDAHAFVYLCIACRPAKRKKLPDGRNVHVTVKPPEWWEAHIAPYRRAGLEIEVSYDEG